MSTTKKWSVRSFINPLILGFSSIFERHLSIELLLLFLLVSLGLLFLEVTFFIRENTRAASKYFVLMLNLLCWLAMCWIFIFHIMIATQAR
jgi:hypothetical protein